MVVAATATKGLGHFRVAIRAIPVDGSSLGSPGVYERRMWTS